MKPHYTQDEANEILRRAVERLPMKDEMSREQLESVAAELGISPEALLKAETDWVAEREEQSDRLAFAASRRVGFYKHVAAYVMVVLMIGIIAGAEGGEEGIIPAVVIGLLWGIGIVCHALSAFNPHSDGYQRSFTQWRIERRAHELATRELGRITPRDDS